MREAIIETRRDFIKKAALLSGAPELWSVLQGSIQRAFAIEPDLGSTYLDAEHIVILMQENRSFDHCFGTLQGVRGFNDPRAITLPNKNPVWLQTNAAGETYGPFRLNLKESKATWMGSLPHTFASQVDARNGGKHDGWLDAKTSGTKEYSRIPLTMGYYNREDIPFYYALADSFTVCDQYFCSALTSTTPNRLYHWTGTVRERKDAACRANMSNSDADYETAVSWPTFPERLEANGVSWRIYQNELSVELGLDDEEASWLANFGDNPLEYFTQYNVRFSEAHRAYLDKNGSAEERERWSSDNFGRLSDHEKNLHNKAFCTNKNDPDYHQLTTLSYQDNETQREMKAPKGDLFHQFRQDVTTGNLPTVSWLVAPDKFSDHPDSAWFGAWYVSQALDILTQNPETWKKTIFLLNYDENDGYFDHVPPFVAPHPQKPNSGLVSKGIDPAVEYVTLEQDRIKASEAEARESPIGLGYRVPMVIASPWSRGGCVCSQVFDHTSVLQFLETFLTQKTGRQIQEPNITNWRRTVCGDLTSAFRPYHGEKIDLPTFISRDPFIEEIHRAQFQNLPTGFKSSSLPSQERGVRHSCALPYQLYVDGSLSDDRSEFTIQLAAHNEVFGKRSAGAPFTVYTTDASGEPQIRNYAVAAGDRLTDTWQLGDFEPKGYRLEVHGPNGFYRSFLGSGDNPPIEIQMIYTSIPGNNKKLTGDVTIQATNHDPTSSHRIEVRDNTFKRRGTIHLLPPGAQVAIVLNTERHFGWYDFSIVVAGFADYGVRYAGHVETGKLSYTDPVMGGVNV